MPLCQYWIHNPTAALTFVQQKPYDPYLFGNIEVLTFRWLIIGVSNNIVQKFNV